MGIRMRALLAGAIVLSACAGVTQIPKPEPAVADEPIEPFHLAIEAGRWGALIYRAQEGMMLRPLDPAAPDENEILRIDASLKTGALAMLALRLEMCRSGLGEAGDCEHESWPEWITQPPSSKVDLQVLQARSDWLGEQTFRFTDTGCEVGRRQSGDELFCSVE
jgi:hypothetical protein